MAWNEASLHRWMRRALAPAGLAAPYGSDAAALAEGLRRPVVCADQTIEGVHFDADTNPARIGRKACARALSDLAASAARPRVVLATLALPEGLEERWVRALLRGLAATARDHGAELVGGDLSRTSGPFVASVTAIGERASRRAVGRFGAEPGDVLLVSGPLGGSRRARHLAIEPRIEAGVWIAAQGASAMMDTSDGPATDLERLARASGVRIEVLTLPVHRDARRAARASGRPALAHALGDGEDHELFATIAPARWARSERREPGVAAEWTIVGRCVAGRGVALPLPDVEGWTHAG